MRKAPSIRSRPDIAMAALARALHSLHTDG